MKNVFVALCVMALVQSVHGQLQPQQDEASMLWGYVNNDGAWVIAPQYYSADIFLDGLGRVTNADSFYGMIDASNELIIPFTHLYLGAESDGLIHAQDLTTGLFGYYSHSGKLVVPFKYEKANAMSSGLGAVRENNLWGFIDKTGKMVITPQFDGTKNSYSDDWLSDFDLDFGYNFYGNYATVKRNGNTGLIDKSGKTIIDFQYGSLALYEQDKFLIASKCDGKNCIYGVLGLNGQTIISFEYSYVEVASGYFKLFQGSTKELLFGSPSGGVIGIADYNGKIIAPCKYDNDGDHLLSNLSLSFSNKRSKGSGVYDNMVLLRKNNLWGYLDLNGNEVIPFQFEDASAFRMDSAEVSLNGYSFYINKQGRCIAGCPDNLSLMTPEKLADQSANYDLVLQTLIKFYLEDYSTYAGSVLTEKAQKVYDENKHRLDLLIAHGTPWQKTWAKHVKFAVAEDVGQLVSKESCRDGLPYLRQVRSLTSEINRSDYPIRFTYQSQERIFRLEDFDLSYRDYFSTIAECEYLDNDPMAVADLKMAISLEEDDFNKALFYGYLIDFKQSSKQYDQELLDYSNLLLKSYSRLPETDREKLKNLNMWTGNQPAAVEAAYTSKVKEPVPTSFYLEAWPLYEQIGDDANASYFMEKLYQKGHDDYGFLWKMADYKKGQGDLEEAGVIAEKLAIKTSATDCDNLQKLAELYLSINQNDNAISMKLKADDCAKAAQKLAEKNARESERKSRRSYSSYSPNPGVYFGVDVFPLLSTVKGHRDFGICMNIVGRESAHEFYYEKINENKDQLFDIANGGNETDGYDVRWNGYQAAYAFKGYLNDDRNVQYFGINLRYRNKTFNPITSYTMDEFNVVTSPEKTYHPTEQQFEFLFNWGVMTTRRGIACDVYYGFGPKYSIFTHHVEDYKDEDVYSHALLEYRKETRWGLGMRIGITIGIKL